MIHLFRVHYPSLESTTCLASLALQGIVDSFKLPYSSLYYLQRQYSTLSALFPEDNAVEFTLTLNYELINVNNWLTSNHICIYDYKTKYIIFLYRKLLNSTNIEIGSATVEETNNIKFF